MIACFLSKHDHSYASVNARFGIGNTASMNSKRQTFKESVALEEIRHH